MVTEVVMTTSGGDGSWGRVLPQCGLPRPALVHIRDTHVHNEGHCQVSVKYGDPTPEALALPPTTRAAVTGQNGGRGPRVGGAGNDVRRGEGGGGGRRV